MSGNTKLKYIVLTFAFIFDCSYSFSQNNKSHFKSELDFGNGVVLSTFLDVSMSQDQFIITSPKNADIRIMGAKARLGRLLGKSPKKGIIMTIAGTQESDSLFGESNIPMIGKVKFKGAIKNNFLSGELLNKDGVSIGTVTGLSSIEDRMSYNDLYPQFIKTIRDNIYSKDALENKEWLKFENKLAKLCNTACDDIELYFGFNILSRKLPFSHVNFIIAQEQEDQQESASTQKSVVFAEKNDSTAYLLIKNFSSSTDELAAILPKIIENTAFRHLILDVRSNGGGGVEAAFELAKYIVTEDLEVGYFVTNKLNYSGFESELFRSLPSVQPESTLEFIKHLKTAPGARLIFKKPANPVFTGSIYVLTNNRTASTCEPLVYAMKNKSKAIIIGEKTAGAMLSAAPFVVSGKYKLMLPVADFYTYDGVRLDKVGVTPNINVQSAEAENVVMEIISGRRTKE